MIEDIVVQEMYHFALAGNMLTAIGGVPSIANAAFIPSYPTNVLPGEILQKLPVDLKPLTPDQVQVFMQIEYPERSRSPQERDPRRSVISTMRSPRASPQSIPRSMPALSRSIRGKQRPIKSIADAQAAILLIKGEGEGTEGSPNQPPTGNATFAHYYVFKEIYTEKTLVQDAPGH